MLILPHKSNICSEFSRRWSIQCVEEHVCFKHKSVKYDSCFYLITTILCAKHKFIIILTVVLDNMNSNSKENCLLLIKFCISSNWKCWIKSATQHYDSNKQQAEMFEMGKININKQHSNNGSNIVIADLLFIMNGWQSVMLTFDIVKSCTAISLVFLFPVIDIIRQPNDQQQ